MDIKQIGVIGYGWLGSALTSHLLRLGLNVVATTQSKDKLPIIEKSGADAEFLSLPCDEFSKHSKLHSCDALIILITPQFKQGKKDYAEKIASLLSSCDPLNIKKVIMVSSTAIYGQQQGVLTESSPIELESEKAKLLHRAEQHVCNYSRTSKVLRVAGLVGPERHPGKFFKPGSVLRTSKALVNLVHQEDVISAIVKVLNTDVATQVYNVCSNTHVSKKEFYQKARCALQLPPLAMSNDNEEIVERVISSELIRKEQLLSFNFDNLLSWLERSK